jgi:serine/threonine-protein kinase
MDLGSTNGTFVNGKKVGAIDLKDGDLIKGGQTVLRVSIVGDDAGGAQGPANQTLPMRPQPVAALPTAHSISVARQPERSRRGGDTQPLVRPPRPVSAACRACESPVMAPTHGAAPAPPLLCPGCQDLARDLAQPIAGYCLVRELGRGGMGVVWLALRMADGQPVALKTILPAMAGTEEQVDRFLREAAILRELDHPHIVAFGDLGESGGQLYFVMDYVRGRNGAQLLKARGGPLPIDRAVGLVCQLLEALEYAHARGFVHRDIKPANLLVTEQDGREFVKLADFGLARVYQASRLSGLTVMGQVAGTMACMAPEQITDLRNVKPPAEQYSAGATLYHLLTRKPIYDLPRDVRQQIPMILQDDPIPIRSRRPEIPDALAAIVHRSLAREPGARFVDVGTMRRALLNLSPG